MEETPGTAVWCAGLRHTGRRELTAAERIDIRYAALSRFYWSALAILALPLPLLLLFLPLMLARAQSVPLPVLAALLIFGLAGTAAQLLKARDWFRWSRTLRRDARQGHVDRFEGVPTSMPVPDETLRRLVDAGLLRTQTEESQWLEVLPESGLVWRVNGERPARWIRAERTDVAEVPDYAATAAQWVTPVEGDSGVYLNHRELSPAEQDELRRHLRRLTIKPILLALALDLWLALALWSGQGRVPEGLGGIRFLLLAVVAAVATFSAVRSTLLALRFRQDLQLGRVIIARSRETSVEPEEGDEDEETRLSPPDEYLPMTRALWTEDGQPAPWRLISGR